MASARAPSRKRKPKREAAPSVETPVDTADDGVKGVYCNIRDGEIVCWPTLRDKSDARVIEEAGTLLWFRTRERPEDELLVGSARVLHALWVMIRARDERASKAMLGLEKLCIEYSDRRAEDTEAEREKTTDPEVKRKLWWVDRWSGQGLPPRAGLDRHRNLSCLVEVADNLRRIQVAGVPDSSPEIRVGIAANFFVTAVMQLFPQLVKDTTDNGRVRRISLAWTNRSLRTRRPFEDLDPELMVVDGLGVLGVPRGKVHNWLKGVPMEREPSENAPDRSTDGRFSRKRTMP